MSGLVRETVIDARYVRRHVVMSCATVVKGARVNTSKELRLLSCDKNVLDKCECR